MPEGNSGLKGCAFDSQGVEDRHPRLGRTGGRQRRRANHVARGIDVRHLRLGKWIDRNQPALAGRDARGGQVQVAELLLRPAATRTPSTESVRPDSNFRITFPSDGRSQA